MTSPHCPAVLLVARHGEAPYPPAGSSEDADRPLSARGAEQARELGRRLRPQRLAAVYSSPLLRAATTGRLAAAELGLSCATDEDLREFEIGEYAGAPRVGPLVDAVFARWVAGDLTAACPGGESAVQVATRFGGALAGIADQHPGETVLVIAHGGAMSLGIPPACGRPDLTRAHRLADCAPAEIEIGADGWRLRHWPGDAD